MFADKLKYLSDKMRDENPWGIIPVDGDFADPKNKQLIKSTFGNYEEKASRIFNILAMDLGYDPVKLVEDEDIDSAREFVSVFSDVLSNMGYKL